MPKSHFRTRPGGQERPLVSPRGFLETLEPRLLFSATLLVDAGPDAAADEGQSVDFAGTFDDLGGGTGAFDLLSLTGNTVDENRLRIDGDRAVWDDGTDVFFYDGTSTGGVPNVLNLSSSIAGNAIDAQIDGDRVAFLVSGSGGGVHVYDITAGTTTHVATSLAGQDVQIEGNLVVWEVDAGAFQVLATIDLSDATPTLDALVGSGPGTSGDMIDPHIADGFVYWVAPGTGGFTDVYGLNVATGTVFNVSNTATQHDQNIRADGGVVTWNTIPEGSATSDVYVFDGRGFDGTGTLPTAVQLDAEGVADINARVSGTNVVWESVTGGTGREVFHYNVDTAATANLSNTAAIGEANPDIDGDNVAWQIDTGGSPVIVHHDLATGTQTVVGPATDAALPAVSGSNIVYLDASGPGGTSEVVFATGGAAAVTYTFDWDFGDGTVLTGATLNESHTYADNGSYSVALTVTTSDGRVTTDTLDATIANVDPTLGAVSIDSAVIDEGGSVTVSGTFADAGSADTHTVDIDWGDGTSSAATVDQLAGTYTATKAYADDDPTGTASDVSAITVTVEDDDAGTAGGGTSVTVNNLAPVVAAISGPAEAVRGQTLTYTGSFTDAGVNDTHTLLFEVRDAANNVVASSATGEISFVASDLGTHTVSLTVTDDDTGVGSSAAATAVTTILVTADPVNAGQTAVLVGGGDNADRIRVRGSSAGLRVNVLDLATGQGDELTGITADRIVVYGNGGDDSIKVFNSAGTTPADIFGGEGDDYLRGGAGDDVIVGGAGDDFISGHSGRDLTIGGQGSDFVIGNRHDDILVAGEYTQENDLAALRAIMAEWTRTDVGYNGRVSNLINGTGLNGSTLLNDATVLDDDRFDLLLGLQGQDWFLANDAQDWTDERRNETLTDTQNDFLDSEDEEA